MSDFELACKVRQLVREAQNILSTSSNPEVNIRTLNRIACLLPNVKDSKSTDFTDDVIIFARQEFIKQHYMRFCDFLIQKLDFDWFGKLSKEQRKCFDAFFLDGIHHEAFMLLCKSVHQASPSFQLHKCTSLLQEFIRQHRMVSLIWSQCTINTDKSSTAPSTHTHTMLWDQLITLISTFPDRMANKLQKQNSELFYPQTYFKILARDTMTVLHDIYKEIKASRDCVVSFISQLIGKICLQGHTETYLGILLPQFIQLTQTDFIWCRICTNIITKIPERCIDYVVEYILQTVPWYGMVSKLLGDSILTNQKLSYIITHKILLLRHYQKELVLHNTIGYLADSPSRKHLLMKCLKTLLEVWGDSSAIRHTSYDQHVYITKAILISIGHLNMKDIQQHKDVLMRTMMSGMQAHLDSPNMKVRRLGMVLAEALTQVIDPKGPALKFEYQDDEETELLKSLLKPAEDPGIQDIESVLSQFALEDDNDTKRKEHAKSVEGEESNNPEDLDSDDDLEPYDMSADTKVSKTKSPMYIRDCMQGLITQDDPDKIEACLTVAEKLIRAKPDDLAEVSVEFVKILLHLQDSHSIEYFTSMRHSAMVAVTVICPVQVAGYLTGEFYSRNYNIRQRMDMLEVLAASAQELSQPSEVVTVSKQTSRSIVTTRISPVEDDSSNPTHWKDIVQKRIDSKTRRFAKGPLKPEAVPVANRFAPVAGHFFFPLLKNYDTSLNTLNLLDQDYLLLGRLLYTLGVVMYAAINAPICHLMARNLLEFIWVTRYHTEGFVRQAILFALSMVILSVPSHFLVSDLQADVMESRLWLQDVIEKDPDTECKKLALQTLMILETALKKELGGDSNV
ncbi:telomere length regulation protein TEL2 homolog [Glandiceps talaboti]